MAEIVSLNQYRRARQRMKAASQASYNRLRHGRTKAETHRDAAIRDLDGNSHEGNRLEQTDVPPDTD